MPASIQVPCRTFVFLVRLHFGGISTSFSSLGIPPSVKGREGPEGKPSHRPQWSGATTALEISVSHTDVLTPSTVGWVCSCCFVFHCQLPRRGSGTATCSALALEQSASNWLDETFHAGAVVNSPKEIDNMDSKKQERAAGQPSNRCQLQRLTSECMWHWANRPCSSLRSVLFILFERPGVERESETQWGR